MNTGIARPENADIYLCKEIYPGSGCDDALAVSVWAAGEGCMVTYWIRESGRWKQLTVFTYSQYPACVQTLAMAIDGLTDDPRLGSIINGNRDYRETALWMRQFAAKLVVEVG